MGFLVILGLGMHHINFNRLFVVGVGYKIHTQWWAQACCICRSWLRLRLVRLYILQSDTKPFIVFYCQNIHSYCVHGEEKAARINYKRGKLTSTIKLQMFNDWQELLANYRMKRQLNTRLYLAMQTFNLIFDYSRYLIPFGAGWLFGLANRVYNLVHPGRPEFWLFALQAAFFPLQGFWNFWVGCVTCQCIQLAQCLFVMSIIDVWAYRENYRTAQRC